MPVHAPDSINKHGESDRSKYRDKEPEGRLFEPDGFPNQPPLSAAVGGRWAQKSWTSWSFTSVAPTIPSTTRCWSTSFSRPSPKVLLEGEQTIEVSVGAPDPAKIPNQGDILGVTVLMITALYRRQEFFRCSYFIYNNYEDESVAAGAESVLLEHVTRSILVDKPRIRLYEVMWDYPTAVKMVPEAMGRVGKSAAKHKKDKGEAEPRRQKISKKRL